MFVLTLLADTIRIPPSLLSQPTLTSIHSQIEQRYPNKVIIDVGLILCPYGPPLQIGDGLLVPGDGGAHHQVLFQCVVFRPFVEEVLVGTVSESTEEGIGVSVGGFFENVFIPAYWMLNPSRYDEGLGLWVWTPTYDEDEEEDNDGEGGGKTAEGDADGEAADENRFEIEIGSEIRFKVKAVNFTRITTTMKGVQATTTTTAHMSNRGFDLTGKKTNGEAGGGASSGSGEGSGNDAAGGDGGVRRRSSSADLSDSNSRPAPMQIVGSICEDGLGLTSWWKSEEEEEEEEGGEGEEEGEYEEEYGDPGGEYYGEE